MSARHLAFANSTISDEMADAILSIIDLRGYELRKKRAPRAKANGIPAGLAYAQALASAQSAATSVLGRNWHLRSDETQWIELERGLRSYRFTRKDGSASIAIKNRPALRAPAPRYWPGGELPAGVNVIPSNP